MLKGRRLVETVCIAQRMCWAAHRETKRPEDWAYCLMGLFSVNMPMLYGEGGGKAFLRLQEAIMRVSDDQSIFAWIDPSMAPETKHGLLADSPAAFGYPEASSMVVYSPFGEQPAFAMTNRGLDIQLHLTRSRKRRNDGDVFAAALNCPHPAKAHSEFLAIYLASSDPRQDQFARVNCREFGALNQRGKLASVVVPQIIPRTSAETVYPLHLFVLNPPELISEVECSRRYEFDRSERYLVYPEWNGYEIDQREEYLVHPEWHGARESRIKIMKQPHQWMAAVRLFRTDKRPEISILLGTRGAFDVGFEALYSGGFNSAKFRDAKANYKPVAGGTTVHLGGLDVKVDMPARTSGGVKIYDVHVTIQVHDADEDGKQLSSFPMSESFVSPRRIGRIQPSISNWTD